MTQNNFCIKSCQFIKFIPAHEAGFATKSQSFRCDYYETELQLDLSPSHNSIRPMRCQACLNDGNKMTGAQIVSVIRGSVETIEGHVRYLKDLLDQLSVEKK